MKRLFWILAFCLAVIGKVYAQEEGDDFFEDDEPSIESDFEYQPPQTPPGEGAPASKPSTRFTRPSFDSGTFPPPQQSVGMNSDGSFEFKLVDPPQFKKPKARLSIPPGVRSKVEGNLKTHKFTDDK